MTKNALIFVILATAVLTLSSAAVLGQGAMQSPSNVVMEVLGFDAGYCRTEANTPGVLEAIPQITAHVCCVFALPCCG